MLACHDCLIRNFAPSLTQSFTQQTVTMQSVKVVNLQKQEVMIIPDSGGLAWLDSNFSWSPSNTKK